MGVTDDQTDVRAPAQDVQHLSAQDEALARLRAALGPTLGPPTLKWEDAVLTVEGLVGINQSQARCIEKMGAEVEYRTGPPTVEQVRAHEARGGWWQARCVDGRLSVCRYRVANDCVQMWFGGEMWLSLPPPDAAEAGQWSIRPCTSNNTPTEWPGEQGPMQAVLRDLIAETIYRHQGGVYPDEFETICGKKQRHWETDAPWDSRDDELCEHERDEYRVQADAVLALLPALASIARDRLAQCYTDVDERWGALRTFVEEVANGDFGPMPDEDDNNRLVSTCLRCRTHYGPCPPNCLTERAKALIARATILRSRP